MKYFQLWKGFLMPFPLLVNSSADSNHYFHPHHHKLVLFVFELYVNENILYILFLKLKFLL